MRKEAAWPGAADERFFTLLAMAAAIEVHDSEHTSVKRRSSVLAEQHGARSMRSRAPYSLCFSMLSYARSTP